MGVLLLHVGADVTNLGAVGPIFPDETFEFIPINNSFGLETRTYVNLSARNREYGETLADFLPRNVARLHPHPDPNFDSYSYGEPDKDEARPRALQKLKQGDLLFFVSSLAPYDPVVYKVKGRMLRTYQRGRKKKYVIGFFTVRGVAQVHVGRSFPNFYIQFLTGSVPEEVIKANHHYQRLRLEDWDEFIVVAGDPEGSALLTHAVRLTERFEHFSFRLNQLGETLLKKKADTLRGLRWIDDKAGGLLSEAIVKTNPELTSRLQLSCV